MQDGTGHDRTGQADIHLDKQKDRQAEEHTDKNWPLESYRVLPLKKYHGNHHRKIERSCTPSRFDLEVSLDQGGGGMISRFVRGNPMRIFQESVR